MINFDNINQENIKEHNMLIVFDDMIANMLSNKKLNPIVTELFIRAKKLNICLVFVTQFFLLCQKNIRVNIIFLS